MDDLIARWRTERVQIKPPDAWGRVAFCILVVVGTALAAHITFSLLWRRPPEQPIERLLSPERRTQIEQCFEIGDALGLVIDKAQMNVQRYAGHPYLFEGQRARLALQLVECGRKARRK